MQAKAQKLWPKILLASMAAACAAPSLCSADILGRLFYSPQERRDLEARRMARPAKAPVINTYQPPKPPPAVPTQMVAPNKPHEPVVNGFVRRSGGVNTVWINEKPVSGDAVREELLQPSAVNSPVRVKQTAR